VKKLNPKPAIIIFSGFGYADVTSTYYGYKREQVSPPSSNQTFPKSGFPIVRLNQKVAIYQHGGGDLF
jgi:hypothetical protein